MADHLEIPRFGNYLPHIQYRDRPGAYALLLNSEGLLARITLPHGYFLPGGGIEAGENAEKALLREIKEETAWEAELTIKLGQASEFLYTKAHKSGVHKLGSFFVAEITRKTTLQPEHDMEWVTPQKLAETLAQGSQRWAITQFAPYLKA